MAEFASSRFAGPYYTRVPSFSTNTAYNGAEGLINDHNSPLSGDLRQDAFDYDDGLTASPPKAYSPPRPALSSRLLSSISNSQPAAAALTRSRSILHSRAKSLAAFVPNFNNSSTEKHFTQVTPNRVFGDLFSGESAPVRFGITPSSPTKEREESEFVMQYKSSLTERPGPGPRRTSAAVSQHQPNSKTTWFGRKVASSASSTAVANDEILNININNSLFPEGPADPLSPHAFNDLLFNATNLLERMQNAYREKVEYIASIRPEIDAQREEVEEADTRAQHLKLQLQDMGQCLQEKETMMKQLVNELTAERIKALEVREAPKTIRHVRSSASDSGDESAPRRRKRGSADNASDSGFESDLDRDNDSVVSHGYVTPRTPLTPPSEEQLRWPQRTQRLQSSVPSHSIGRTRRMGGNEAAWVTIDQLRGENQGLRDEVDLMRQTLQGCIDFVGDVRT